jgi:tetratricopeptide (TPR) repeat protein
MIRRKVFVAAALAAWWCSAGAVAAQDLQNQPAAPATLSPRQLEEMRGDIAMAKKIYTDAVTHYQKALQLEPRSASLMNKIGIAYHQLMQLNQAKKYYERAIKADQSYANAINNLGMVHYNKKKYKKAAREFERALQLKPGIATFESNLGHSYWGLKRYDDAFGAFSRALELDPQVFERRGSMVGVILENRAVEERALYYFFVAKTFAARGDAERCAQYLRKARDEGYKNILSIEKDAAFAAVIKDPLIQEFLAQTQTLAQTPRPE